MYIDNVDIKINSCKKEIIAKQDKIIISGPCAIESYEQLLETAKFVKSQGVNVLRGGAFVLVDKVKTSVLDIHDMYNDLYYDFKRENGLTDTEIIDKNVSLRGVQKCLTVEENIQLLKEVGFNKIDIFYKIFNFVGIIAIK